MKTSGLKYIVTAAFGAVFLSVPAALAGPEPCDDGQSVVIRRTVPYPRAVDRAPLTSDQLSTTSTRYIDARRGHRPYSTVHNAGVACGHRVLIGYDDHFGITRPEYRPRSYSQRTPRTGVTRHTNPSAAQSDETRADPQPALEIIVVVRDERALRNGAEPNDQARANEPDMRIRIHNDEPEMPSRSGAVLITADGTVIQVGD